MRPDIRTSKSDPLRIDALSAGPGLGQVGMTICPGKQGPSLSGFFWERDLDVDLAVIAAWPATAVVTLIEQEEFRAVQVECLGQRVRALGMEWHHLPIKDLNAPDERFEEGWRRSGPELLHHLRSGLNVLVHCMGGRGRAGTVCARLLVELGHAPDIAIDRVRKARDGAIETPAQLNYVRNRLSDMGQAASQPASRPYRGPTESWFKEITGFEECLGPDGYARTQANLSVEGSRLRSKVSGRSVGIGRLELLSLQELRHRAGRGGRVEGVRRIRYLVGDVGHLHTLDEHNRAVFQVASQFNLLEMPSENVGPEAGVTGYLYDGTQGPACAMACGAATIYRNYLVPVQGQVGQRSDLQLDGLALLGTELGRQLGLPMGSLWSMRNGYALFKKGALELVAQHLAGLSEPDLDGIRQLLQVGIQWSAEVTATGAPAGQHVTQAFCSALPIGYHRGPGWADAPWTPIAQLILDALYEATLWAAVLNARDGGSNQVLLTFVGGGVFRNAMAWIRSAIERAVTLTSHYDLDVAVVFREPPDPEAQAWVASLNGYQRARIGSEESEVAAGTESAIAKRSDVNSGNLNAADLRAQLMELSRYPSDWRLVLGQLVTSVSYCTDAGSAAWSVTLKRAAYRLNVGNVEAMTTQVSAMEAARFGLASDRSFADVRLLISGPLAPVLVEQLRDRCDVEEETYKSVGEPHWSVRVTIPLSTPPSDHERAEAMRDLFALQAAHRHFIGKAVTTSTGAIRKLSNYHQKHCIALYQCALGFTQAAGALPLPGEFLWDEDLLPEHVPGPSATWDEVSNFALSFNGDVLDRPLPWEVLEQAIERPDVSTAVLRQWMYSFQRGWRWGSYDGAPPSPETMARVHAVLGMIRDRVARAQQCHP